MPNKYLPKILHKGELIEFIPKVLIENIEKETGATRKRAVKIVEEVGRQFIAAHIKVTTKPMIREKTNSVMVDLGYLEARKRYTRIGMSMHDLRTTIFEIGLDLETQKRLLYDHMKEEYDGVKELKYDD